MRRAGADPESANSILLPFPDVKFQVAASNFRLPLLVLTTVALRVYVSSSFANTNDIVILVAELFNSLMFLHFLIHFLERVSSD